MQYIQKSPQIFAFFLNLSILDQFILYIEVVVIARLQKFRSLLVMSGGYLFAVGSIMIMYTLLPVIFSQLWGSTIAGIVMMIMTMLQVFLF